MTTFHFDVTPEEFGIDADEDTLVRVWIDTDEMTAEFAAYEPNCPDPWGRNPNNMLIEKLDYDEAMEVYKKVSK